MNSPNRRNGITRLFIGVLDKDQDSDIDCSIFLMLG